MYLPKSLSAICVPLKDAALLRTTTRGLPHIWVDCESQLAVATDGTMLAAVPFVPKEGDVSGWLSAQALAAAHKEKGKWKGHCIHGAETTAVGGVLYPNPFAGEDDAPTAPQWERCVPPLDLESSFPVSGFDAARVLKLATILQEVRQCRHPAVKLIATSPTGPIHVWLPNLPAGCVAVVMPYNL